MTDAELAELEKRMLYRPDDINSTRQDAPLLLAEIRRLRRIEMAIRRIVRDDTDAATDPELRAALDGAAEPPKE